MQIDTKIISATVSQISGWVHFYILKTYRNEPLQGHRKDASQNRLEILLILDSQKLEATPLPSPVLSMNLILVPS